VTLVGRELSRVLIVDDEDHSRSAIAMVLRIKGFEVVSVESCGSALQEFEDSRVDLVVIDLFLPDIMGGIEFIRTLRERTPNLPIVAISGATTLEFLAQESELSTVIRLPKPFRPTELMLAIEKATHPACDEGAYDDD
jgi:DNA-binding response OmpR family regulator